MKAFAMATTLVAQCAIEKRSERTLEIPVCHSCVLADPDANAEFQKSYTIHCI